MSSRADADGRTAVGTSVPRKEDKRFLTGLGKFTDDLSIPGQAYAVVVRSPHPHAELVTVHEGMAALAPGVLLVLSADSIGNEVGPMPSFSVLPPFDVRGRNGSPGAEAPQPILARGKVRYVGEPVALVVAESRDQAIDAAELVRVEYRELPSAASVPQGLASDAPLIWDELPSNVSIDWPGSSSADAHAHFAAAHHVAEVELVTNRVAPSFLEPRAAIGQFDSGTGRWTLQLGCQGAHGMQALLAGMLSVEFDKVRVQVADVGGGFGARSPVYPEYALVLLAARRLGRAVKWTSERSEAFLSDVQARDQIMGGRLALDENLRFTAVELALDWRHSAYIVAQGLWVMTHYFGATVGGAYAIPQRSFSLRGVFTNTPPIGAYRGIGRMEANYVLECLVDQAARDFDTDPVELRKRNLIAPGDLPWTTPSGDTITSGEFGRILDRATELADWADFERRRIKSAQAGLLRGIGVGMYVENDGSTPNEFTELEAHGDATVTVRVGTQDFGMSHETVYSQIAAEALGIPFDDIRVQFGDTSRVKRGSGTGGSRSARMGGSAVVRGAEAMVEAGRAFAADLLEAASADIEHASGQYSVAGTDRTVTLGEVTAYAQTQGQTLSGEADFVTAQDVHANGCHVCEVTVDPETGAIRLERHVIVADPGRALNPMVVYGQVHGGATQGLGQALLEEIVFDPVTGQTVTGSFMDYTLPRADDFPEPSVVLHEVFESDNPLGVKGIGESSATGAPAAVMNAVRDALHQVGAGAVEMPATSERVWRALRNTE